MATALLNLCDVLMGKDRYYFAKFLRTFADDVPACHQRGLLEYIAAEVGGERWAKLSADSYQHLDMVRSMLWHYSGTEGPKTNDPCPKDLIKLIAAYIRSTKYREAEEAKDASSLSVAEMIRDIEL